MLEEPALSSLLDCILRRFNLMVYMLRNNPDEVIINSKRSKYLKSILVYNRKILGSIPENRANKLERLKRRNIEDQIDNILN